MNETQLRNKAVSILQGWIGRKESNGTHKMIIDTYNNHLPLARGYKVKYTDAWCATTITAVAIVAGLTDIIPKECSCNKMIELFKNLGRWMEADSYVPYPGDIIFYDWDDKGSGDCTGSSEHVGMVEVVSKSSITVIEGNKNDEVGRRTIQINGKFIRGYGIPDYASKAAKAQDVNGDGRVDANDALEMLKQSAGMTVKTGDYDANDALKILKQSAGVTNQAKKEEVVMGIVTGTGVRVRKGPGTNYAVVTRVNKGNTVRIWKEQNGWYMIDKDKWVSGKYIAKKC